MNVKVEDDVYSLLYYIIYPATQPTIVGKGHEALCVGY